MIDNRPLRNRHINAGITWAEPVNSPNPIHYTDDFTKDRGFFTEENGTKDFKIGNGEMTVKADNKGSLAYLHIFEKNVALKARFKYSNSEPSDAFLEFSLRYNSEHAHVSLRYYHKSGAWALIGSEGRDFPLYRYADTNDYRIEPDTWHDIEFTLDKQTATAILDGKEIFQIEDIDHESPGRIAVGAKRMTLTLCSFDAAFLSDQGTLWSGVVHNKLPDEKYREGGSVFELNDGKLVYTHHSGVSFTSVDNGVTWHRAEKIWTDTHGYPNILRLLNGDFIKIITKNIDGKLYKASQTSCDDGNTWIDGGCICITPYKGDTCAIAVNMNDKVTQISNGRVFYCQNYEALPFGSKVDGRTVFCEFYYSDDNGKSWTKSETDSWELGGNEDQVWFGECKILECDDGTLRIYNSWNDYGCIVYSESTDGGVTWGPLNKMPEFVCARSSMQFYRDPYADNNTTYYMVWVYSPMIGNANPMTRSRLSLARSTDGKSWDFLGDLWRWETKHTTGSHYCHVVDAFVKTTKDYVICGAGYSEHLELAEVGTDGYHHAQRQHIYSIKKECLKAVPLKPVQ